LSLNIPQTLTRSKKEGTKRGREGEGKGKEGQKKGRRKREV